MENISDSLKVKSSQRAVLLRFPREFSLPLLNGIKIDPAAFRESAPRSAVHTFAETVPPASLNNEISANFAIQQRFEVASVPCGSTEDIYRPIVNGAIGKKFSRVISIRQHIVTDRLLSSIVPEKVVQSKKKQEEKKRKKEVAKTLSAL